MNSPEAFYLHISGSQRGPYTIGQLDHMLNSGIVGAETLYWREGLEQWEPVTNLVVLRQKPKAWRKPLIALAVLAILAIPLRLFGPVIAEGWREANQHSFTAEAAYWRARDVVRTQAVGGGDLVSFGDFEEAVVQLHEPARAEVMLRGELTGKDGKTRAASWLVLMKFDSRAKEWSGAPSRELATAR